MMFLATLILALSAAPFATAETLSFPRVWREIDGGSAARESAQLMLDAAAESKVRAERHWLPRLFLDAKSYQSNDPSTAFMGLLEQRSVQQADFSPTAINQPESHVYSRAALGVDLPLYQGGTGAAQVAATGAAVAAKSEDLQQVRLDQYVEAGKAYASIAELEAGLKKLGELRAEVLRLQKGYQLGVKSNPVGYSGALGMRALALRLEALLQQYTSQRSALVAELKELGLGAIDWNPESALATAFADRYFDARARQAGSHRLESLRGQAEVAEKSVQLERGKGLPQLGVFAEGYGFNGNRDTATGYSAGLYLRWNIFNPADYGTSREASLKAAGAERLADAFGQQERAESAGLEAATTALRSNLELLSKTEELLGEQAEIAETLFRNGSINALQFVEVVGRRADVAEQRLEAGLNYLKLASEALSKRRPDLTALAGGK